MHPAKPLQCIYFSPRSTPPWPAVRGAVPTFLTGLGPLRCVVELAAALTPHAPHRKGDFRIFICAALTSGHLNLEYIWQAFKTNLQMISADNLCK